MASVLLIDDDEALRNVTVEILKEAGYVVDDAPDGRSGLELFRTGKHELVITDIAMPDMDGIELIIDLTRAAPRPQIIAISGDSQFSTSVYLPTAKQLGVHSTLTKPIRAAELLSAIEAALAAAPKR